MEILRMEWNNLPLGFVADGALGEDCDDGNTDDSDGCSSLCKMEEGWRCDVPADSGEEAPEGGSKCSSLPRFGCDGLHPSPHIKKSGDCFSGLT